MPYGVPGSIKTQLNSTQIGVVFYLVDIIRESGTIRVAEKQITWGVNTYEARLKSIEGLDRQVGGEASSISIVLSNIDGQVTAWDQDLTFLGAKIKIYEYVESLDGSVADGYLKWQGVGDEITELGFEEATIPAYYGPITLRLEAPRRQVTQQCGWTFDQVTTTSTEVRSSAFSTVNFEGFECPYSSVGFKGDLQNALAASDTPANVPFNVHWSSSDFAAGSQLIAGDFIKIDNEIMLVTLANPGQTQFVQADRAQLGTVVGAHSTDTGNVKFASCQKDTNACTRRGLYGNNAADTFSGTKRNYFGGFPITSKIVKPPFPSMQYIVWYLNGGRSNFGGNVSAYGSSLSLIYGNVLVKDNILLAVSDQQDFLTTIWLIGEGVIGTNNTNDTLDNDRLFAVGGYTGVGGTEHVYMNGKLRHDTHANFGIELYLGDKDRTPPSTSGFFSNASIPEFVTNKLAFHGSLWLVIKTKKENNETVTPQSGLDLEFEVKYGRIIRVYNSTPGGGQDENDPSLFTRKANTNPAWVILDFETSKRGGGCLDYRNFNIQSFIDVANYCSQNVVNVIDASSVPRWTFNGMVGASRKGFQDWERLMCMGPSILPPFMGADGKLKIKALKAENPISGLVPFFSDQSGDPSERNIMWEGGHSTLTKSRKSVLDVPNQVNVNYMERDPSDGKWYKVTGQINDDFIQTQIGRILGDNSKRVVAKTVDLIGVITRDEAARAASLILRVGEFAAGGLDNNNIIKFKTFYKTSADIELGDIIEVQSDMLDPGQGEEFYRVTEIADGRMDAPNGGFFLTREITATIHDDGYYDDSSGALTTMRYIPHNSPNDGEAPPVTDATLTEQGIFDNTGTPITRLTFGFTEPDPLDNYKNVSIWRSHLENPTLPYDEITNPALDDWRHVTELYVSGDTVNWEIDNQYEVFTFLSRNLHGNTPSPKTRLPDDSGFKYPRISVFLDGVADGDIIGPPQNVVIDTVSTDSALAVNEFRATFGIPTANSQTYAAYAWLLNDTNTFPVNEYQAAYSVYSVGGVPGTGMLTYGSSIFEDPTQSWPDLTGFRLFYFSNKRKTDGTASWWGEGFIGMDTIVSNTPTQLTLGLSFNPYQTMTNMQYMIMAPTDRYGWELMAYNSGAVSDSNRNTGIPRTFRGVYDLSGDYYVFGFLITMWGVGQLYTSPTPIHLDSVSDSVGQTIGMTAFFPQGMAGDGNTYDIAKAETDTEWEFPANLTTWKVSVRTNPSTTVNYLFKKNGVQFGQLQITAGGGTTFSTTLAGVTQFTNNDLFSITTPNDSSIQNVLITAWGTRI